MTGLPLRPLGVILTVAFLQAEGRISAQKSASTEIPPPAELRRGLTHPSRDRGPKL